MRPFMDVQVRLPVMVILYRLPRVGGSGVVQDLLVLGAKNGRYLRKHCRNSVSNYRIAMDKHAGSNLRSKAIERLMAGRKLWYRRRMVDLAHPRMRNTVGGGLGMFFLGRACSARCHIRMTFHY